MRNPNSRIGGIHVLTTCTGCSVSIDLKVTLVDLNLDTIVNQKVAAVRVIDDDIELSFSNLCFDNVTSPAPQFELIDVGLNLTETSSSSKGKGRHRRRHSLMRAHMF